MRQEHMEREREHALIRCKVRARPRVRFGLALHGAVHDFARKVELCLVSFTWSWLCQCHFRILQWRVDTTDTPQKQAKNY